MTDTISNSNNNVLTLCLTGTTAAATVTNSKKKSSSNNSNNSRREIVHFHKTRATVKDLYLRAEELFGTVAAASSTAETNDTAAIAKKKPSNKKKSSSSAATASFIMILERRAGFPPRAQRLDRDSDQTLQQAGIENQERITVSFIPETPNAATSSQPAAAASNPQGKKRSTAATATKASTIEATTATIDENKTVVQRSKKISKKDNEEEEASCCSEQAEENNDTTTASATTGRTGSKRAAAQRATESFAVTIAAQDALMAQQANQQQSASNKKRRASPAAAKSKKKTTASAATAANPRFTANRTSAGRRLQDGAIVSRPPPTQHRRRSRASGTGPGESNDHEMTDNVDDPQARAGIALLGALNGDDSSRGARLMRQNWRQAVLDAYEQNQATARLAALAAASTATSSSSTVAPGGASVVQFQCWKPAGDHSSSLVAVTADESAALTEDEQEDSDDAATRKATWQLEVTYPKGVQGRGNFEERVDYISYSVLKNAVRAIYPFNSEALRPENLAPLSPRLFWSLLFHWQRRRQGQQNHDGGNSNGTTRNTNAIHEALMTMNPDLDWSFLRRRKQQLSQKALENLRQQQQTQVQREENSSSSSLSSVGQDYEAAAAAISAAEQIMQDLTAVNPSQRQARTLQAAQRRATATAAAASGGTSTDTDAAAAADESDAMDHAIIVTPTETDEDELKACILAGLTSRDEHEEAAKDDGNDDSDAVWDQVVISIEMDDGATRAYTVRNMVDALIQDCNIHNWRELANSTGAEALVQQLFAVKSKKSGDDNDDALTDMVQAWMDHAREESLDEIMVEICQGQIDAVQLLEQAKAATPKDLAIWKYIVDDLYKVLQQHAVATSTATEHQETTPSTDVVVPTKQDLEQWCQRAQWALEQWEWLDNYSTAIE